MSNDSRAAPAVLDGRPRIAGGPDPVTRPNTAGSFQREFMTRRRTRARAESLKACSRRKDARPLAVGFLRPVTGFSLDGQPLPSAMTSAWHGSGRKVELLTTHLKCLEANANMPFMCADSDGGASRLVTLRVIGEPGGGCFAAEHFPGGNRNRLQVGALAGWCPYPTRVAVLASIAASEGGRRGPQLAVQNRVGFCGYIGDRTDAVVAGALRRLRSAPEKIASSRWRAAPDRLWRYLEPASFLTERP